MVEDCQEEAVDFLCCNAWLGGLMWLQMVKQAAAEPWKAVYEFTYACITQKVYKCNYWGRGLKVLKLGVGV